MPFPYRDWRVFESAHVEGSDPNNNSFSAIGDWNTNTFNYMKTGDAEDVEGGPYRRWTAMTRPTDSNFQSYDSLDEILDIYVEAIITENVNTRPQLTLYIFPKFFYQAVGEWVVGAVTGKHYDGVNPWDAFARSTLSGFGETAQITLANTPQTMGTWFYSYVGGTGPTTNDDQAKFFRNGVGFYAVTYDPLIDDPDECNVFISPVLMRARYLNATVNSLSTNHAGTAGGETVILTGICFDPSNAELNEHTVGGGPGWNADVAFIYFETTLGGEDYTLTAGAGIGKFIINSDGQITATLPAMVAGDYYIRLKKVNVTTIGSINSYVGDFTANDDGAVTAGTRTLFAIGDAFDPPEETQPLILTDWRWKNKAGDIALDNVSFIDVRAPSVFYDGRIINISSLKREVDDETGLFSISDVTIDLANHDKKYSKLLADYFLKNQTVDIYQHFGSQPFADKTHIHKVIVDDYSLNGTTFSVLLKDITRKYFGVRVPRFRCTEDEYANIHDSAKGVAMPEILGLCSVTGDTPGAAEAVYINTVTFRYLAARGSLYAVDNVYSDNIEMTGGGVDFNIVYADGGRTYIDFVNDQGDNKITFNCKGYAYNVLYNWNSANDYIQSPIYITAFLLAFIAEIPWELIDLTSFDTLATEFIAEGWDETGHLILQNEADLDEVLKDLLFTCGNYGFIAINGQFKVVRKDIDDYIDTTLRIYDQIDVMTPAKRSYNLNAAVNYIQSIYNFFPAPNQSFGSFEDKRESSIEDYEAEIEAGSPVSFPWTNSLTLVRDRLTTMLLKRGYGDHRISFSLSIKWFKQLDLLDNFQYQDPFGLSSTGAGEVGRYYYIISINYNWMSATIDIEAVDLQWLLRQYFILGDYAVLAATWDLETEANKIYGFLCNYDTKEFADGEPGKIISSEGA